MAETTPEETATASRRLFTGQFVLLILSASLFFGSMYFLIPILPGYAVGLGAEPSAVGLVTGAFTITALLSRPSVGRASETLGRKPLFVAGAAIFAVSPLLYIFSTSIPLLVGARAFHGLGIALFTVGAMTLAADIIPPARRGEGMGIYGLATLLGMSIAPPLAEPLVATYGFTGVFIIASFTATVSLAISALVTEKKRGHRRVTTLGFVATARHRWLLVPSIVLAASALTFGAIVTFLPLFTAERQAGTAGLFLAVYAVSTAITRIPIGRLSDRIGRRFVVVPSLVAMALAMISLAFVDSAVQLVLVAIVYGASFGSMMPIMTALVVDRSPEHSRGIALSIVTASFDLGIGLGAIALGVVGGAFGFASIYLVAGVLSLAGALTFVLGDIRDGQP